MSRPIAESQHCARAKTRPYVFLSRRIRYHLPFLIVIPLLIIATTWPAFAQIFDTETIAFPTRSADVYQKLWDVWHGGRFLAGETSFYHSDAMFYPIGASLAYENFSLPHMLSVGLLGAVLPVANAYSLTYLLIVFAVSLSGYVYFHYLFGDRWLATFGAAVFGFSQHVIAHGAHPDVNLIISLPLSAYCFQRGLREGRLRHLICCGAIVGITAFMSLYIFVCALITLALFILCYAIDRWNDERFWRRMLALALVIAVASAGRILPMLADGAELAAALDKNTSYETGTDLLSAFINYRHPITTPLLKALFDAGSPFYEPHTSYLGYLPLALIIIGFLRPSGRRLMLPWLALALPFLLLRLGSVLQIDGIQYPHIVLPKSLLDDLLPALFSPFHAADHFQMGVLLPLAVMSAYGLKSILDARPSNQRALIALAFIAGIAFEYYESTTPRVLPAAQLNFIEWLRADDADQEKRLINLPMGRQPSKLYGFYQSLTGYPQVEGLTGRTPPAAYAYIEGNYLLKAWRGGDSVQCFPPHHAAVVAALDQLRGDGFTHVVWHHWLGEDAAIANSFADAQSAYDDDYVSIYRLTELRQICDLSNSLSPSVLAPLRRLNASPAIVPRQGAAILSVLPDAEADQSAGRPGAAVLFGPHRYANLALVDGAVIAQPAPDESPAADEILARSSVILLAYDPQTADADAISSYRAWLDPRFKSCRRLTETRAAIVEYFLDAAFPCELAVVEQPLNIDYANGARLGNLLVEAGADHLDLHLLWARLPDEAHAYAIQFMDAEGARVGGDDFVIGLEPLAQHRIETSTLPAGEYRVNMILYAYATGASVPGALTASGSRFERMFEIATWTTE